jgi:hypothetical protein
MEITLGLLAASMPILGGFFKTHSVDSIVKGARSIFSLGSSASSRSQSLDNSKGMSENPVSLQSKESGSIHREGVV